MFCSVIIKSARLIYEMLYKTVTYVPGTFVTLDPGLYKTEGNVPKQDNHYCLCEMFDLFSLAQEMRIAASPMMRRSFQTF